MPPTEEWHSLAPGPESVTWRRAGDVRVLLAAGYALLLQVSHPTVGAGVSEHSQFQRDPWGRLLRTLDYACTMVYAGPRPAGEMGGRIRSFHKQVYGTAVDGTRYHALEPEAYAWVHATLAAGIVSAHERFGRPFSAAQREQLWAEWRSAGRLLGVRERDLPAGWRGFREYFDAMVGERLRHTAAVDEVLEALARPSPPAMPALGELGWRAACPALAHGVLVASVGLLPPPLRRRFGLRWTRTNDLELRAAGRLLRAMTPLMPSWLLNTGPGYLRWRADAIARGEVAAPGLLSSS
ncbi:MAG TPA: oxygenase MpaB family protein [Solirubrobacteraceae bacterium]